MSGAGLALALAAAMASATPLAASAGDGHGATLAETRAHRLALSNGLAVELYPASYLAETSLLTLDGATYLALPEGERFEVITSVTDPAVPNTGDGDFFPATADEVRDALADLRLEGMDLSLTVYILPYPRRANLDSGAEGSTIYVSPGVVEYTQKAISLIVAHELGHVFQHHRLPRGDGEGWVSYREIRGITDCEVYDWSAPHADRPQEIFAEDFRLLFGSEAAAAVPHENATLAPPSTVPGLPEFMSALLEAPAPAPRSLLSLGNAPNPFNPITTIRLVLAPERVGSSESLRVGVYDARGGFVKDLYRGPVRGERMTLTWDGTDDRGGRVASGLYFYRASLGAEVESGKMILAK
jgi:hypothetical protein